MIVPKISPIYHLFSSNWLIDCPVFLLQDPRFNKDIDTRTGYRTVSVMCQPILNFQGDVIGVAQCINKVTGDHQFTEQDQEVRADKHLFSEQDLLYLALLDYLACVLRDRAPCHHPEVIMASCI
ncbi:hypothetical protein AVEN_214458-1 [Araneus ventricosus]|uniref:GAF domain-containing protein n=1 Tax=Araneus ventricosus TaxID=182803 RepID=A0A4Y2CXV0_ARAVE|nr:hypothetical protein AVEN_214458-1 [Araneus ventricosus]